MKRFSYASGAAIAAFAAGPVFLTTLIVGSSLLYPSANILGPISGLIGVGLASVPFGIFLGGIPIVLGGYIMGKLGQCYVGSRNILIWAGAGALFAAPAPLLMMFSLDWKIEGLFAATGAICALLVRYGTRWSDDASA